MLAKGISRCRILLKVARNLQLQLLFSIWLLLNHIASAVFLQSFVGSCDIVDLAGLDPRHLEEVLAWEILVVELALLQVVDEHLLLRALCHLLELLQLVLLEHGECLLVVDLLLLEVPELLLVLIGSDLLLVILAEQRPLFVVVG